MTSMQIVGNVLSGIGMILFFISSFLKSKKKILLFQIGNHSLSSVAQFFFSDGHGFSGAVQDSVSIIRNIVIIFNKNNKFLSGLFIFLALGLGVFFNVYSYLGDHNVWLFVAGFLPVVASLEYSIVILLPNVKVVHIKMAMVVSSLCWAIYGFFIVNYALAIFNIIICISSLVNIFRYYLGSKSVKDKEALAGDTNEE